MLTLTLMEDNSINKKSSKLFHEITKTEVKKSKKEIEQFSERLSTALRRNRNPLNSASASNNRLFTKVFTNENDSTFTSELILKTHNNVGDNLGEYLNNNNNNNNNKTVENVKKRKDSWSLNECLQEINSIRYDNFINEVPKNTNLHSPKADKNRKTLTDNDLNFYRENERQARKEKSRRSSYSSVKSDQQSIDLLSSEDELLFREEEGSITSSRSSISWAADAIEAKLTLQLAKHWEEIELVCSGQLREQPKSMSDSVYEECLLWKRAFPEKSENPSRFSTMAVVDEDEENESTPTPTNTQISGGFNSAIRSARHPGSLLKYDELDFDIESRAENCVTPNPNNSSEYVTAWLTENHPYHQQFSFEQTEPEIFQNEAPKIEEKHSAHNYNSLNTNISFTRTSNGSEEYVIKQQSSMNSGNNRNGSGNSSKHNSAKHRILNDLITNQAIQSNTISSFSRFSNQFGTENLQSTASPKKSTFEPFLPYSNKEFQSIGGSEYKDGSLVNSNNRSTNSGVPRQRPNNLRLRATTNNQLIKSNELESSPTKPPFLLWLFDKS